MSLCRGDLAAPETVERGSLVAAGIGDKEMLRHRKASCQREHPDPALQTGTVATTTRRAIATRVSDGTLVIIGAACDQRSPTAPLPYAVTRTCSTRTITSYLVRVTLSYMIIDRQYSNTPLTLPTWPRQLRRSCRSAAVSRACDATSTDAGKSSARLRRPAIVHPIRVRWVPTRLFSSHARIVSSKVTPNARMPRTLPTPYGGAEVHLPTEIPRNHRAHADGSAATSMNTSATGASTTSAKFLSDLGSPWKLMSP